jgi:hypothetical protein
MTAPHPTSCSRCGDRFRRASEALHHICRPNNTGFNLREDVLVDGTPGVVTQVDRGLVQVYFRSSFRSLWLSPDLLERVA